MYGLVNKAVEQMVCTQFDEQTWERIKARAGIDDDMFLCMHQYPDDMTYRLVGAASAVLGLTQAEVLQAFGRYWTMYTANEGYGELMQMAGGTLVEFLTNLDNLHTRVGLSYPNLQPPSFQCSDITDRSLRLHYYSGRQGLAPMVVGLLEGLAQRFQTPIDIELLSDQDLGADHEVFQITFRT